MLSYEVLKNELRIRVAWRDLLLRVYLYLCKNQTRDLDDELRLRGIAPMESATLIPITLVETPLQLLQGALHYKFYANRVERIRNRGLLLALMITGLRQLSDLLNTLSSELRRGIDYYMVSVDVSPKNTENCAEVDITDLGNRSLGALVKNTKFVISLI